MEATMTVSGITEAKADVKRARLYLDTGQDFVLRDLADLWRKGEEEVFASEGNALGRRWPALKPATVKSRTYLIRRFGLQIAPAKPVLVQYGDLRDALRHKGGAQEQYVGRTSVRIAVDGARINRHDRARGLGLTLTKTGKRRKPRGRGRGRYPSNIMEIHEANDRPMVGTPGHIQFEQAERVKRHLDHVSRLMNGGIDPMGASEWEGWGD